jgi:hypothetical protein
MESLARRWLSIGVAALLLLALGALIMVRKGNQPPRVVPEGVRVKVEVLNASGRRGLAYRATLVLRQAGFDVVRFASDTTVAESTLVIVRSSAADWAVQAAKVLGAQRVVSLPDSARYLDLTVRLGRDWQPPAQPFYP